MKNGMKRSMKTRSFSFRPFEAMISISCEEVTKEPCNEFRCVEWSLSEKQRRGKSLRFFWLWLWSNSMAVVFFYGSNESKISFRFSIFSILSMYVHGIFTWGTPVLSVSDGKKFLRFLRCAPGWVVQEGMSPAPMLPGHKPPMQNMKSMGAPIGPNIPLGKSQFHQNREMKWNEMNIPNQSIKSLKIMIQILQSSRFWPSEMVTLTDRRCHGGTCGMWLVVEVKDSSNAISSGSRAGEDTSTWKSKQKHP